MTAVNWRPTATLLAATGRDHGRVSLCRQHPGDKFVAVVVDAGALSRGQLDPTGGRLANVWASAGILRDGPITGRGKASDVVGMPSLFADLDVEPGKIPSLEVARQIIDDLSELLGAQPCAVVASGHGLQPWWRLADEPGVSSWAPDDDAARQRMTALLKGFGRLVAQVAERYGATVDSGVYELARVMRLPCPGGANLKELS